MKPLPSLAAYNAGDEFIVDDSIDRVDVPVRHYSYHVETAPNTAEVKHLYLAIDPLIEDAIKEFYTAGNERRMREMFNNYKEEQYKAEKLQQRIYQYNARPWYKRIFNLV
jgi:hypothetical protein